ncbi:MAG: chromate transporter [Deltaproteobacteria bacterium]|nr:chromate transporter [Deltaproteobacteria bacterium]
MSRHSDWKDLRTLFLVFLRIGAFTLGGGYVMVPMIQRELVEKRRMVTPGKFLDIMAWAQCGPGGVAINASSIVGYTVAGIRGALVATVATVIPSFVAILAIAAAFLRYRSLPAVEAFLYGARPAVVGLLVVAVWSMGRQVVNDRWTVGLALGGFVLVSLAGVHPALVILGAVVAGYVFCPKEKWDRPRDPGAA